MLDSLKGGYGNGYFSQAVAEYAKKMKPEMRKGAPKTIDEFTDGEWDKLLDKVDDAIEEYRADLKEREEEALDKQKEQHESYILGQGEKKERQFEEQVLMDNGCFRTMRFMKVDSMGANDGMDSVPKQPDIRDTIDDMVSDEMIQKLLGNDRRAPYSAMANENGIIEYKGVTFQCDYEHNRLCLGNVSDIRQCITVELEGGGVLVFNRENIDDLVRAIDMFSPADINRIMRAIAQDAKLRQIQAEIEDETSGEEVLDKPEDEKKVQAAGEQKDENGIGEPKEER